MRKFYRVLPAGQEALATRQYRFVLALFIILLGPTPAFSQQPALFEDFENVETGKLPDGWTWYQQGGTNPASHWTTYRYTGFGTRHATSGLELGDGTMDSDWLITPQITLGPEHYLIFDGAQSTWSTYGDEYLILVSTTTPDAPIAFKDTVARYTEDEFPKSWTTVKIDLSAYAGKSVYIAFVHVTTYLSQEANDVSNAFLLDEVWVRPLQSASLYEALATYQDLTAVSVDKSYLMVNLQMNVRVSGDNGTVSLDALTFSTQGTPDPSIIEKAILCYTGPDNLLSIEDTESYSIYGTIKEPNGTFVFSGQQDLPIGNNYFWLVYVVKPETKPVFPYPRIDATFEEVLVNGTTYPTTVSTKPGAVAVVPNLPPNDNVNDAMEITGTGRYGSSNVNATPERDIETLAYCAPGGTDDGANSIWWHFKAPADGWITADLSGSAFNSLLVFLDTNFDQLACHDNIDATQDKLEARISNFAVAAGQELYLRVTGVGNIFGGPQNAARGEVVMDFTFDRPMGTEPGNDIFRFSAPYPNPASTYTAVEVSTRKATDITLHVYDGLGRRVLSVPTGFHAAGEKQKILVDVARLPAGTYIIGVEGSSVPAGKLMVVR